MLAKIDFFFLLWKRCLGKEGGHIAAQCEGKWTLRSVVDDVTNCGVEGRIDSLKHQQL